MLMNRWLFAAAMIFLCGLVASLAENPGAKKSSESPFIVDTWPSGPGDQKLPESAVIALTQTHDGYLWLGTQKGLVRFDGLNFRMFSQTTGGSPMGPVLGLLADGEGNLWVRLGGPGLLCYRDGKFDDYSDKFDITEAAVTWMFRAADGRAMFATILNGIVAYAHGKFSRVAGAPHFPNFLVTSTVPGPGGTYWLGTRDRGLFHLSDGTISAAREVLTDRKINALLSAVDKQLWIGTDNGLFRLTGERIERVDNTSDFPLLAVHAIAEDSQGRLWAGGSGLVRLEGDSARDG